MTGEDPGPVITGSIGWAPDYKSPKPKVFDPNHDRYKKSNKTEKRFASRLGAKLQPRSGGLGWSPGDSTTAGGDFTSDDLHVEHKRAEPKTKSIGVKREWLRAVTEGARRRNRIPAMGLTFEDPEGHAEDWVALPLEFVERLLALLKDDA